MDNTKNILFDNWLQEEIAETKFCDKRLDSRFKVLLKQLWNNLGQPIPFACQDWANTKAAYRFLSNAKVTEEKILNCHFESTKQRIQNTTTSKILVIQDTTEFSYHRKEAGKIGFTKLLNLNNSLYKKCGVLMHSSLAVTSEGLPLGLAIKFWSRDKFKGTNEMKKKINPMRVPIEDKESIRWLENLKSSISLIQAPDRCVHVGDRESDIYEFFCLAKDLNTNFVIRSCHNRKIDGENQKIEDKMKTAPIIGNHTIDLVTGDKKTRKAKLNIKFQRLEFSVPVDKKKTCKAVSVTIIDAKEENCPENETPVFWRLITNLEVNSFPEAIEKIFWYQQRWKIEVFHKILKSGLNAESLKFQSTQRLANII